MGAGQRLNLFVYSFFLCSCTVLTGKKTLSVGTVESKTACKNVMKKTTNVPSLEVFTHGNICSQPVKFSLVLLDFIPCECAAQQP